MLLLLVVFGGGGSRVKLRVRKPFQSSNFSLQNTASDFS